MPDLVNILSVPPWANTVHGDEPDGDFIPEPCGRCGARIPVGDVVARESRLMQIVVRPDDAIALTRDGLSSVGSVALTRLCATHSTAVEW